MTASFDASSIPSCPEDGNKVGKRRVALKVHRFVATERGDMLGTHRDSWQGKDPLPQVGEGCQLFLPFLRHVCIVK
jgi:hypothetical protein